MHTINRQKNVEIDQVFKTDVTFVSEQQFDLPKGCKSDNFQFDLS